MVWLGKYPTQEVLGDLYGVSDTTAGSCLRRVLSLLEAVGRDTMQMPQSSCKQRCQLSDLLQGVPELAVIIETFEQPVPRPQARTEADSYYSGKNSKQATVEKSEFVSMQIPDFGLPQSQLTILLKGNL